MKITQDGDYAAKQGIAVRRRAAKGMEAKAVEFVKKGEIYNQGDDLVRVCPDSSDPRRVRASRQVNPTLPGFVRRVPPFVAC